VHVLDRVLFLNAADNRTRKRKKKSYREWWQDRIETLSGYQNEARALHQTAHEAYPVGAWAILKLALVAYYIDLYTSIIKKIFPKSYYVDTFAGPGLNKINETDDIVFGSPLLADRVPSEGKKFDKLILVENNPTRRNALGRLLPSAAIMPEDINRTGITSILAHLAESNIPSLVFVDPEGLAIHWRTLEKILSCWCDVMINYQPTSVRRIVGSARSNAVYEQSLNDFFGSDEWKACSNDEELLGLYTENLQKHREVVIPVKVQSPEAFYYYIIIVVRKTAGNQAWVEAIHRAKKNVEQATSEDAKRLLDVYMGRQATINGL
jgi:three-Cys-motif partner protein